MKNIIILLFSTLFLCVSAQDSKQLIRFHNVTDITTLNAIVSPLAGQIVFVESEDAHYENDGSIWKKITNSSSITEIVDGDGDTRVRVDNGSDNDIIQFTTAGQTNFEIDGNLFRAINTNQSVYIGNTGTQATKSVLIGHDVLTSGSGTTETVAVGYKAMENAAGGIKNTAVGAYALMASGSGSNNNTAAGHSALKANTSGDNNSALGGSALLANTLGNNNTAVGYRALRLNTTGNDNVAIGTQALRSNTTGSRNVCIGDATMYTNTTGNGNVGIGADVILNWPDLDNNVRIGLNTMTYFGVQVAWSITSDLHWKDSVQSLSHGLSLIKELRPVDYLRKEAYHNKKEIGFIAQELEVALKKVGYHDQGFLTKGDQGLFEVRYNDFIGIAVKAIQEQQQTIANNLVEMESSQAELLEMKKRLALLEDQIK